MKDKDVLVSICCVTYNQEDYIERAIEGFLSQQASFNYEILIYDDASLDATQEILKSYEAKYPDLIKVFYQSENQFSKGVHVHSILWPYCKGKYIALCDGDDYWIDSNKLQLQISAFDKNPKSDICFHGYVNILNEVELSRVLMNKNSYSLSDVIRGGGEFMSTSSLMIRSSLIKKIPNWYFSCPVGDYFLQVFGAKNFNAIYIQECMSVYRLMSKGSWSLLAKKYSAEKIESRFHAIDDCMKNLYVELGARYKRDISYARSNIFMSKALAYLRIFDLYRVSKFILIAMLLSPGAVYQKIIKKLIN